MNEVQKKEREDDFNHYAHYRLKRALEEFEKGNHKHADAFVKSYLTCREIAMKGYE